MATPSPVITIYIYVRHWAECKYQGDEFWSAGLALSQ